MVWRASHGGCLRGGVSLAAMMGPRRARRALLQVRPWTAALLRVKGAAESWYREKTGVSLSFNVCLGNYYEDGQHRIGWHTDREEIGRTTPIISLSLGAERRFLVGLGSRSRSMHTHPRRRSACVAMGGGAGAGHERPRRRGRADAGTRLPRGDGERVPAPLRALRAARAPGTLDIS
jgi:alkylated DNA repair dioxygenase AlkB